MPYIWVIGTRTGKKLTKWKLVRTDKSKNWHDLEPFYLILAGKIVQNKISGLRSNLGCAPHAQSWVFFQNCQLQIFCCFITQHQNCFAHNSAIKYHSEACLYSKRTAGYPLSYKDHCCSFFTSRVIKQQKCCILKVLKKHPTLGVPYTP